VKLHVPSTPLKFLVQQAGCLVLEASMGAPFTQDVGLSNPYRHWNTTRAMGCYRGHRTEWLSPRPPAPNG
jgi:hypothetical protein